MEHIIAKLLQDFEHGKMNRRQLIQSLALTATAASAIVTAPAAAAAGPSLTATSVNHISFDVRDYTKIRDFYAGLFGMKVFDDTNGKQCHIQVGNTYLTPRNAGPGKTTPRVEHIAIAIEKFDLKTVNAAMASRGIKMRGRNSSGEDLNPQIQDPEGFTLQVVPQKYVATEFNKQKRNL